MNRIKSFFIGLMLLAASFAMVLLVTLVYRSVKQLSVKSYMFQIDNYANMRVGAMQKLEDMSAIELRNKMIKKYVSEYFLVVPGEKNVLARPMLHKLSTPHAYEQWQLNEAEKITKMATKKMFRRVHISEADIAAMDLPDGYDYYSATPDEAIWYSIHYTTETWSESNSMGVEPVYETGNIYIQASFRPGIKPDVNVKKYLESGENPVGLFMFKVVDIDNGENE